MGGPTKLRVRPRPADRDLRRAWLAVAALPVAFLAAMLIGEGLLSALGYGGATPADVPVRAVLLAAVPALLVLITPGLVAVRYGRRARRDGRPDAMLPAWIGGGIAALTVLLNVLPVIVAR